MARTRKNKAISTTGLRQGFGRISKVKSPQVQASRLKLKQKNKNIPKVTNKVDKNEKACLPNHLVMEHFLPERPKMYANAFALFVHDYARKVEFRGKAYFIRAASEWKKIPNSTKDGYATRVAKNKQRYRKEFSQWSLIRQMLRAPPNPYALFVKGVYGHCTNLKDCQGGFEGISKEIAKKWATLPQHQKKEFEEKSEAYRQDYNEMVEKLVRGVNVIQILHEQLTASDLTESKA